MFRGAPIFFLRLNQPKSVAVLLEFVKIGDTYICLFKFCAYCGVLKSEVDKMLFIMPKSLATVINSRILSILNYYNLLNYS